MTILDRPEFAEVKKESIRINNEFDRIFRGHSPDGSRESGQRAVDYQTVVDAMVPTNDLGEKMTCRAKFKVDKVTIYGPMYREITLSAVYDDGLSKENKSFATATPSGTLTFTLTNPALMETFQPGQYYYLDFTQVSQ